MDPRSDGAGFPGGGASEVKLLREDLATNQVERVYPFDERAAPSKPYRNNVGIAHGHAFMSDSGLDAIVVLDLAAGWPRRLLADHPSTKTEAASNRSSVGGSFTSRHDHNEPR